MSAKSAVDVLFIQQINQGISLKLQPLNKGENQTNGKLF